MKKILAMMAVALSFALVGCSDDDDDTVELSFDMLTAQKEAWNLVPETVVQVVNSEAEMRQCVSDTFMETHTDWLEVDFAKKSVVYCRLPVYDLEQLQQVMLWAFYSETPGTYVPVIALHYGSEDFSEDPSLYGTVTLGIVVDKLPATAMIEPSIYIGYSQE